MAGSKAIIDLRAGLKAVDDVLSYVKPSAGQPSKKEKSLFVASVALSYAMWENYAEEVAIEVTTVLSAQINQRDVPESVRESIKKMQPPPDAWDLVVHPGWRELWVQMVRTRAKGDAANARDFGILTANAKAVSSLFERVGVDPFAAVAQDDLDKLDKLVEQRGQIVHTGKAPPNFYKKDALDWRDFVKSLAEKVDAGISVGGGRLIGKAPW